MAEQANELESGDILKGAKAIAAFLTELGLPTTKQGVYYGAKTGKLQVGRYRKDFIASKARLRRQVRQLVAV
jgi:hypothetical protein